MTPITIAQTASNTFALTFSDASAVPFVHSVPCTNTYTVATASTSGAAASASVTALAVLVAAVAALAM